MTRRPGDSEQEAGFTLVELLLTVAILGVGMLVIVGGMMTSIQVSDLGRRQADGQTQLRAYAEAVAGATYVNCATSYTTYTPPTGYTALLVVSYWDGTSAFVTTCPTPDKGLQKITLTISTTDSRGSESVSLAKRTP
jgi:prepilin-type N-terminal cleavage/methylation domain-containing protein